MPFIPKKEREEIDAGRKPQTSGERCYWYYSRMMKQWRKSPRWTTADEIYTDVMATPHASVPWQRAKELAWQVFFALHVKPYEIAKMEENGDI
jgi:hypothetical protein